MLRKLVLLAISSGLLKAAYDAYKAKKAETSMHPATASPVATTAPAATANAREA
jgi:hypothetical protein